jgi:Ca2+-binding RTX toxin-like protein
VRLRPLILALAVLLPAFTVPVAAPTVASCRGIPATLVGTAGPDRLQGTAGPDVIAAAEGSDVVLARAGDDVVCGGPGADLVRGGDGADLLLGGMGMDSLLGGDHDDEIWGGWGNDGCLQGPGTGMRNSCTVRIAAAGDIACEPGWSTTATRCRMQATSNLVTRHGFVAVLPLGDTQYEDGRRWKYRRSYHPTWGRVKGVSHPVVGNHEYGTPGAAGYFDYFGSAAGRRGYYSVQLDEWNLVVLNSVCYAVGGCGRGSPQLRWLRNELETDPPGCTVAAWHHPRFSSGPHGNDGAFDRFWRNLYAGGAELVLNGHDHLYERFAPQDPDGRRDRDRGIREFVVGTGGRSLYPVETVRRNSVVRRTGTFGVLVLELYPDRYDWRFVGIHGGTLDSGSTACH